MTRLTTLLSFLLFMQCDGRERIKMNNRVHRNCTEVVPEVMNAKIGPGAAAQSGDDVDRTISTPAVRIVWMWWAQGWGQAPPSSERARAAGSGPTQRGLYADSQ